MVELLLKRCVVCLKHRRSNTRAPLELIVASIVLERLEIDLVDIRSQKDGNMKWIRHVKDYFSKYATLYAMPNKKASTVAQFLYMFVLHFGIPDIIQCDNGTELKGAVILLLARYGFKIIND